MRSVIALVCVVALSGSAFGQPDENYVLSVGDEDGTIFNDSVSVPVMLDNDNGDPVEGYQFGVCIDDDTVVSIDNDDDIANGTAIDDLAFTFSAINTFGDHWNVGVIFEVSMQVTLDNADDHELYIASYAVIAEEEASTDLNICPDDLNPEVYSMVVGGSDTEPEISNGSITLSAVNPDYTLAMDVGGAAVLGGNVEVTVTLDHSDGDPLGGYQFGVCNDDLLSIDDDGDVANGEAISDLAFTFSAVNTFGTHWNVGVIFEVSMQVTLDPNDSDSPHDLYVVTYTVNEDNEGTSDLEFCTDDLNPARISVVVDNNDVTPVSEDATVEVTDMIFAFKRGDIDGDGTTNAIDDALFLFEYGFIEGDEPPCMDAADINDNGEVQPLLDGILLIGYQFQAGTPPADPGPDDCGTDPTSDSVTCNTIPEVCATP